MNSEDLSIQSDHVPTTKPSYSGKKTAMVFTMTVVSLCALLFVYIRGQDLNWDLQNYHYYSGYALLHWRYEHDVAAARLQTFLNPMTNVIAYLSYKYLPFPFSSWGLLSIQLVSIPALVCIAREIGKELGYAKTSLTEILALLLCLLSPLWWSELGTTFFSSWTAPLILWGFYVLIRGFPARQTYWNGLVAAGMLFGFAVGVKLTNGPFVVAAYVTITFLLYGQTWKIFVNKLSIFTAGIVLGCLATAWWNVYLWGEWRSPVFPFYNAIFASPYFDLENFRDTRWKFQSISEFISFVGQAAWNTGKTSEAEFADLRFLIIGMLIPCAMLRKSAQPYGRRSIAFMLFVLSAFALWATMFAYQRYLIPVELLMGFVIWVLVWRLIQRESMRIAVLACLLVLSACLFKVPDWGHAKAVFGSRNAFDIHVPEQMSSTPARYIIVGQPLGYLLPSLHPDSIFYGVDVSRQIDELILARLNQPSELPLRIIASENDEPKLWDCLKNFRIAQQSHRMNCIPFQTKIGRYVICDVYPASRG